MNPPINRENLRDVLIAVAIAMGLTWGVAAFRKCAAGIMPMRTTLAAQFVPSHHAPRNKAVRTQRALIPSNF